MNEVQHLDTALAPLVQDLGGNQATLLAGAIALVLRDAPHRTSPPLTRGEFAQVLKADAHAESAPEAETSFQARARDIVLSAAREVPLDQSSNRALAEVGRVLHRAVLVKKHRELANELVRVWTRTTDNSVVVPRSEIAHFMVEATRSAPGARILCPELGSEPIAIACMQMGYTPICLSDPPPYMALVVSLLIDSPLRFGFRSGDFDLQEGTRYDGIPYSQVIVPRFSETANHIDRKSPASLEFEWGREESDALHRAAKSNSGCAVVLVSTRALFSRGVAARKFRRFLVESGRLQSIVSFPAGSLTGSPIPFSILVFDDQTAEDDHSSITFCKVDEDLHFAFPPGQLRTREGTFTGGPGVLRALRNPNDLPWCRSVSRARVAKEDYILAVGRYLDTDAQGALKQASRKRSTVLLADVADVIKAQSLRSTAAPAAAIVREISPSEFPQFGYLKNASRQRAVEPDDLQRHAKQVLNNSDVLLSSKGTIGRTAVALPNPDHCPIVASPSTVILRLKANGPIREPVALLMYLRSPLFQSLLSAVVVGTTIPNVSLFDLRKLPVVVPTSDEQLQMRLAFDNQVRIQQQIDQLQQQQAAIAHETWTALSLAEMEKRA